SYRTNWSSDCIYLYLLLACGDHPDLPSFPTRRSSDLDEVPAPHLDGLEPQLARHATDDALHHEGAMGAPGPAVRRHDRRVRVHDVELDGVMGQPVGAGQLRRGDQRHDDPVRDRKSVV